MDFMIVCYELMWTTLDGNTDYGDMDSDRGIIRELCNSTRRLPNNFTVISESYFFPLTSKTPILKDGEFGLW
ncbi:hypothetical protein EYC80_002505 [Monilinia laxa]|uniref:Uncharacterized protein n=1 Tax=Monilinia laxa TaxID=61186 RepID=A0A5N6K445_MONLA|nr:hypothetical protein EYC80_002505 [Monilinia laxa]